MGWFSSSKQEEPDAITRSGRQHCWDSRDAYFACLDGANVLKAGDEGGACAKESGEYEKNCAKSWVSMILVERDTMNVTDAVC
jgi:cytochrome c oxidase assembly factor 6